ncbi:MAG TPA: DNA primase, partial [Isoptericola sp.]|nr:DNA primase [Isoptericola sp.]
ARAASTPSRGSRQDQRQDQRRDARPEAEAAPVTPVLAAPDPRDPVARLERQALIVVLQYPQHVPASFDELGEDAFGVPAWRAVHDAVRAAGGVAAGREVGGGRWVESVTEQAPETVSPLVTELAVAPVPEDRESVIGAYVADVVRALVDLGLTRRIADAKSRLQRLDQEKDPEAYQQAFTDLLAIEQQRRALRERGES